MVVCATVWSPSSGMWVGGAGTLARMDRQDSPYRRGTRYSMMPIPMVEDHCRAVPAGPVQLVVEYRRLTDAILAETYADSANKPDQAVSFDDGGPSLHVCGSADGVEHVRFDCFEHEPHYHYLHQPGLGNTVVRIDEAASGDPVEFALACARHRLPDMLEVAGAAELAQQLRMADVDLDGAVAEVRRLMVSAVAVA